MAMIVLGIESSCDETAAAVVRDGREVLSSVVASQISLHQEYGGVMPEVASRSHFQAILPVIERALKEASVSIGDLDAIAVTRGPGLIGSLLIGLSTAKAIAYARHVPFVGVHHIEGHLASIFLDKDMPNFPLVALVASGGHTSLFFMPEFGTYEILGQTMDDAAGEAFDKVAKLLGLPYPGGPEIDRLAQGGNPNSIFFPRPKPQSLDFSFSGLKTAVAVWIQKNGMPETVEQKADLAASFQEAVVDSLLDKLFRAAEEKNISNVCAVGGVACNTRLRTKLKDRALGEGLAFWISSPKYSTDNAAMIASAAYGRVLRKEFDSINLGAQATMPISPS